MSTESKNFRYISNSPDYRHLDDKERYKALYDEVGTVQANQVIRWREEWMKYFNPRSAATILELGSHNGPNLLHYARLGHTVCGVELSDTLAQTFEAALAQEPREIRERIKLHRGWIEDFVPEARFDEVLCTEILEHAIDPVAILKVARTALKPGGRVYISSPASLWGNNTHVRAVPVADLKQWLEAAGLCPVEIWCEDDRTFCVAHESEVRVIGMIRIRNESAIIEDTLNHMARFCSGGIYVYDDLSVDDTAARCDAHPAVRGVVRGAYWDSNRGRANYENRAAVLAAAQKDARPQDWLVYLDADERIEFNWSDLFDLPEDVIAVRMKLFDFYITADDVDQGYQARQWMGPEYRPIIIAYRNLPTLRFRHLGQREVELGTEGRIVEGGFVKHYGKAISIEQWEDTCNYYSTYFPAYAAKWNARRGKAVHTASDFGRDLIRWEEKETKGVLLTPPSESAASRSHNGNSGPRLRILLANHQLLDFTGSELFTLTLADSLQRLGHEVTVYSPYVDKLRQRFDSIHVRVIENLDEIRSESFDVAHVHHNITAMEVRHCFPLLPMVYLSHGVIPFLEQPPAVDLQITRYLAVSEEVRDALIAHGIRETTVDIFRNIVDSHRFTPAKSIGETPVTALVLSARIDERREAVIRDACAKLGIAVKFLGGRFGEVTPAQLPVHINNADIVFSLGRGAIETMMCGRIPIIFDYLGGDGMVTPENVRNLMACNFSGRRHRKDYSADDLVSEIRYYKKKNGETLRALALEFFDAQRNTPALVDIYIGCSKSPVAPMHGRDQKLLTAFVETIRETRAYTYNRLTRSSVKPAQPQGIHAIPFPTVGSGPDDWTESIRQLESLLWLNEEDPQAHNELGLLHYHSGDKFRALAHFQRAAGLLPQDEQLARHLNVLYPELVGTLIADVGGKTEHVRALEEHVRNLETDLRNARVRAESLEAHTGNLEERVQAAEAHARNVEANAQNVGTHAQNVEAHARNLEEQVQGLEAHAVNVEANLRQLETHTRNLEDERRRPQDLLESQRQPASHMHTFVEKMSDLISKIRHDGIEAIAVYGAGDAGQAFIALCRIANIRVRCAVDRNEQLWGTEVAGIRVISLADAIKEGNNVYAVASLSFERDISRDIRARYSETGQGVRIYAPGQGSRSAPAATSLLK